MQERTTRLATVLTVALAVLAPLRAQTPHASIGNGGELYEIHLGAYAELFIDDGAVPADHPVLALDVVRDGRIVRLLVPGTEGREIDDTPLVIYDRAFDALSVLWQTREPDHRLTGVYLASFADDAWSEVYPLATADGVELAAVHTLGHYRHRFDLPEVGRVESRRQILHLLWQERHGDQVALFYAPLTFSQGVYAGWHRSYALLEQVAPTGIAGGAPSGALRRALALNSSDPATLAALVVDPRTDLVVSLALDAGALEPTLLADEIRLQVLDAFGGLDGQGLTLAAGGMRAQIINAGFQAGVEPELTAYLADTAGAWTAGWLAQHPQGTAEQLADDLWALILDVASVLLVSDDGTAAPGAAGDGPSGPLLAVAVTGSRPAPASGSGLTRAYVAADGSGALIAWYDQQASQVHWVESADPAAAWSAVRSLAIDPETMPLARADALLAERLE